MNKLLTISIPTYNRSELLKKCLLSISESMKQITIEERKLISIYISDNSDNLETFDMLNENEKLFSGLDIHYDKNESNIGSDRNIAKAYSKPNSNYVLVLGDDDFLCIDFLIKIIPILKTNIYSLIFLKYFGLTADKTGYLKDNREIKKVEYQSNYDILLDRNISLTFISGMIFRTNSFSSSDVEKGIGTSLVQVNLALHLLLNNSKVVFINHNLIAATRNNTGGYDPTEIFLTKFFEILSEYGNLGLNDLELQKIKNRMLLTFYIRSFAQYMRNNNAILSKKQLTILNLQYHNYIPYNVVIKRLFMVKKGFYLLFLLYVICNIYYYPYKLREYMYHFMNYLKIKLKLI